MVLHNPNNWHWVNKDVSSWARTYLEENLVGISAEENGVTAKINKLVSMDGDVDVSQRKGKVITLFDVKLQLDYEGLWICLPTYPSCLAFSDSNAYIQFDRLSRLSSG